MRAVVMEPPAQLFGMSGIPVWSVAGRQTVLIRITDKNALRTQLHPLESNTYRLFHKWGAIA